MTKTAKTQGIFEITSKVQNSNGFSLKGASTQIEVCTRDYKTWCKKGKAPKTMQQEFDRVCALAGSKEIDPEIVFTVKILEVCTTADELAKAKVRHGLVKNAVTTLPADVASNLLASLGLLVPTETAPSTDLPATDSAEPTPSSDTTEPANPDAERVVPLHPLVTEYNQQLAEAEALASNPAPEADLPATEVSEPIADETLPAEPVASKPSGKRKDRKTA